MSTLTSSTPIRTASLGISLWVPLLVSFYLDIPIKNFCINPFFIFAFNPIKFVTAIMPWNFPIWVPYKAFLPPFVIGNTILFKGAPGTP